MTWSGFGMTGNLIECKFHLSQQINELAFLWNFSDFLLNQINVNYYLHNS